MKKEHRLNRPPTSKWTHSLLLVLVVFGLLLAAGMAFANSANSQGEGQKADDENAVSAIVEETGRETLAQRTASSVPRKQKAPVFSEPPTAGWRIYIDPDTGKRLSRPPAGSGGIQQLSAETRRALSTSHEGLFEELMPDGSYRLNLQGRFRGLSSATVADDGAIQVTHQALDRAEAPAQSSSTPSTSRPSAAGDADSNKEVRNDR